MTAEITRDLTLRMTTELTFENLERLSRCILRVWLWGVYVDYMHTYIHTCIYV